MAYGDTAQKEDSCYLNECEIYVRVQFPIQTVKGENIRRDKTNSDLKVRATFARVWKGTSNHFGGFGLIFFKQDKLKDG